MASPSVKAIVASVLDGEGAGPSTIHVTFVSSPRMRALNRSTFGRDYATDVIGFSLPHGDALVGDVYICPATARRSARRLGITSREELTRLVVHGVLHVLGHDHPTGDSRTQSPMWRRQEGYVREVLEVRR